MIKTYFRTLFFLNIIFVFFLGALESCKKAEAIQINRPPLTDTTNNSELSEHSFNLLTSDSATHSLFLYYPAEAKFNKGKGRLWQGVPTIGILKNQLFAAWYCGEQGEEPGNYITVATSNDMGLTWKENALVIAPENDSLREVDPSLWNDRYGNLHLSWTYTAGMWDGKTAAVWEIGIKKVGDLIYATKPTKLFNGNMSVKPTPLGRDSSILLFPADGCSIGFQYGTPTKVWNTIPTPHDLNGPFIFESGYDEKNKILKTPQKVARIYDDLRSRNFDEHMVVVIDDSHFVCMLRTIYGINISTSSDAGATWSPPTPFLNLGTISPSRCFFGRLKSGNILFVCNNGPNRTNLTAFLSNDNGLTWPHKLLLDTRTGAAYPDVVQNEVGDILLVRDRSRAAEGEIMLSKFTEDDIIKGNSGNITNIMISQLK